MIPTDYHLHSTHSADAEGTVLEMCEAALARGLKEVGFAEHLDFDRTDPHYGYLDPEAYAEAVEAARSIYAGRLVVRRGLEFDFRRAYGAEVDEVLAGLEGIDFLVGAVHTAAGVRLWTLNRGVPPDLDLAALVDEYLAEVEALVASGLCHVLAHFDYVFKQVPDLAETWRTARYWERVDGILARCIAGGVALEVNSHHIEDRGLGLAADAEILAHYRRLGGRRVTVGSDAHRPSAVAHGFGRVEAVLREVGFTEVTGFARGRPYPVPLG